MISILQKMASIIDMRSDTVTKPTPEMREAMATAEVGDDVYGDDPTVKRLEERAAAILDKEAGLFVPTGTMGNLISVLVHCRTRGDEFIVGNLAHIYLYEQGGSAQIGGVHPRVLNNNKDGTLNLSDIESAIRGDDVHYPVTRLICLENTHNRCGGRVLKTSYVDAVGEIAKKRGLKLHIDGARLMNAATALNEDPARMVQAADSVSLCLSKALGAPIGSVIVGTKEFIYHARRLRKALGGGMRQVGVIAAPALIALEQMPKRLHIDHANTKRLADGIVAMTSLGVTTDLAAVESNIVFVEIVRDGLSAGPVVDRLKERGVLVSAFSDKVIRFTGNYHVTSDHVDQVLAHLSAVLKEL